MAKRKKRMKINSVRLYRVSAFYKSDQLEGLGIAC